MSLRCPDFGVVYNVQVSLLVRCPDFEVVVYTNWVLGTAKSVLFVEVSLFQDMLNKRFCCT